MGVSEHFEIYGDAAIHGAGSRPVISMNFHTINKCQYAGDGFPVSTKSQHASYSRQPCIHGGGSCYQ